MTVTRHDHAAVATLTMDDGKLNALSDEMLAALMEHLRALAEDRAIRAVILAARGRAFCAGHDLRQMQAMRQAPDAGRVALADLFERCSGVMLAIRALPQPVIARVHGAAVAAGCQLVASCDMAVAATGARFGVNGVDIGLFCSTPMVALTRAVPAKAAFEMLSTGRLIDAEEAARIGLVNRAVAAEALEGEARALAEAVAGKLGAATRIGKGLFHAQIDRAEAEAYVLAGEAMVANMLEADTDEGIDAFLARRPPNWSQNG
ncbi:MAG: enoyl-CoA hydratase [Paracoccaceae bacterium]